MAVTEAKKRANKKYNAKTYKVFRVNVRQDDVELIKHLESQEAISGYILNLIKADMNK